MLIKLFGEVSEESSDAVCDAIITAGILNDDITFLISTYGGEFYAALAIYDLLKLHPKKVTTVAVGPCMSAGAVILQAGDVRAMTENAQIMVHYGESGSGDEGDARQNEAMHFKHKKLVGEKVTVTGRTVNNWFRQNTYFDAERALEAGLVDEVYKCHKKIK